MNSFKNNNNVYMHEEPYWRR